MANEVSGGDYTFTEIVRAVEILQKSNRIDEVRKICDQIGFRMTINDLGHAQKIGDELSISASLIADLDPDYYEKHLAGNDKNMLRGPCPCR